MKKKLVLSLLSVISAGFVNFSSADDTGIISSIQNFTINIGNYFGILIQRLTNFFGAVIDVIGYVISILKAIRFGLISLISGVRDLIIEVLEGGVFVNVSSTFTQLGDYIGGPGVVFISTMLLLIMFRIGIAFVFKILKLGTDYNMRKTEWSEGKKSSSHDSARGDIKFDF